MGAAAQFYVRVVPDDRVPTLGELKWESRAEELSFKALDDIRSAAEKWAGTIASIIAVFGVVTLVKGPEDISKVAGSFGMSLEHWVALTIGLAVGFAVAATWFAATAAYGLPKILRFVGVEVRQRYHAEARRARWRLTAARWFSVAAVALLAVAIGITWLKTAEPPPAAIEVIDANGIRACGTLATSSKPGRLLVFEQGRELPTEVSIAGVRAVVAVATCPGG